MSSYKERMIRVKDTAAAGAIDGTHAVLAYELANDPIAGDYTERDPATGTEGAKPERLYNIASGSRFKVDMGFGYAAGTPPSYAALLRACGWSEVISAGTSVTYSPTPPNDTFGQVDFDIRQGDGVQRVTNARGSNNFSVTSGQTPMMEFDLRGIYNDPASVAPWAQPDFSSWKSAPLARPTNISAFTLGGTELCATEFSWSDGRTPRVDKYMNCAGTDIITRRFTGRMVVKWPDIATKDIIVNSRTGILEPIVWEIDQLAPETGTLRIAAPKVQIKFGGETDIDGELGAILDLVFVPDQGDDELSIIFT